MNNNILKVAKREYLKIVKRRSFWLTILALPIIYFILGMLVGGSAEETEKRIAEEAAEATEIIIIDQAQIIDDEMLVSPMKIADDIEASRKKVQAGDADAVIVYPADIAESKKITLFATQTNIISRDRFNDLAVNLLKQSILNDIEDNDRIALFNAELNIEKTLYQDGEETTEGLEGFIIPIVAVIIYFMLLILSGNFMLSSVSEEKENRVAETLLSIMTPRQLIWGKMIGLTGVAFTQVAALISFGAIAVLISSSPLLSFDIDWAAIDINILQIITAFFFIIAGFIFITSIMVGVGAAMPTQREAQQFSGIFLLLSLFPIYLAPLLLIDPAGLLARVVSYFPFTAPLILLLRSTIDALPLWELILGMVLVIGYVFIGFFIAYKLFELGSMELSNKVSLRAIFQKEKRNK